jgi:nicotinamide riboside transporter PnuC
MSFEIITWIISGLALTGTILNSNRNKYGFILWFGTNLFWTIVDFKAGLYAQSALFFAYTILAVKGIYTWTKKEQIEHENKGA